MKIPSNKVADILWYFRQELATRYDVSEIDQMAAWCFEDFVGMSRTSLLTRPDATVNESDLLRFHFAVKALRTGRPIQYILGKTDFYGLTLKVNENVLIPRPETEELVAWICADRKTDTSTFSIIDIGTGSGCIALALKKNLPQTHIYALDASLGALSIARENAHTTENELHFLHLDILENSTAAKIPNCTIMVSNPPYIKRSESSSMAEHVLQHEPNEALFVPDDDALIFYHAIGKLALEKLKPNGALYFEINEALGYETCMLLQQLGFGDVELRQDMQGKDRMIRARKEKSIH
jgi:release factor glutamine methyltransferase